MTVTRWRRRYAHRLCLRLALVRLGPKIQRRQHIGEDIIHRLGQHKGELGTHIFGQIVQVGLVALGDDHFVEAGAMGGENLLFDPANRHHPPT